MLRLTSRTLLSVEIDDVIPGWRLPLDELFQ
jgi:hypothetical protein